MIQKKMYRYVKIQLRREGTTCMTFLHSSDEYTDWTELNPLNHLNILNLLNLLNPLNLLNLLNLLNHLNILNLLNPYPGHKTKTAKTPCGRCKTSLTSHRCCARLKILKQAWIFSASPTITISGLCIPRKAINKDKPSCPLDSILLQIGHHMRSGAWRALP